MRIFGLLILSFLLAGCASERPVTEIPIAAAAIAAQPPSPSVQTEAGLASNLNLDWPVDRATMTRGFRPKRVRGKRPHFGIDLAAKRGTPIFAAQEGIVIYSGKAFKGFGRLIMIEGKNELTTLYAHLSKSYVREGQQVKIGDRIADMGNTGHSTGPHLHFEVRQNRVPVDPMLYLRPGSVAAESP